MAIIGNTVVLSMESYKDNNSRTELLNNLNVFFTIVFAIEMLIKLWCLGGIMNYSKDPFNIFDAVLVILSIFGLVIEHLDMGSGGVSALTAFRALRLLRVFKLAKRMDSLLTLFQAIKETLSDLGYFTLLIFLFIFICALFGREYFAYNIRFVSLDT